MSYELARDTIATYIRDNWDNSYPMFAENQGETQPAGAFARYALRPVDATSLDIGSTVGFGRRVNGLLYFQFFCLEGRGSSDAMKFADKIQLLFDEKVIFDTDGYPIIFRRTELAYIGAEPSGRQQWNITVPFRMDR